MKIIYLLILLLFFSCSQDESYIPKDIIQKEKMVSIFVDIHISDALVAHKKNKEVKISNQLKKTYLANILNKHKISMEDYEKSQVFYKNNLPLLLEVYNEVMIELSAKKAEFEGKKLTKEEIEKKKKEENKKTNKKKSLIEKLNENQ